MADGMWVLHDDGEFELIEPYKTMLVEAKLSATRGWRDSLLGYLEPRCVYDFDMLAGELLRRNEREDLSAMETLEGFVLDALSGDL